jgi:hypothetical protein
VLTNAAELYEGAGAHVAAGAFYARLLQIRVHDNSEAALPAALLEYPAVHFAPLPVPPPARPAAASLPPVGPSRAD